MDEIFTPNKNGSVWKIAHDGVIDRFIVFINYWKGSVKKNERKMEKRQISKNLRKIINLRFTDRQREVHSEPYAYIRHSVITIYL